MLLSSLFFIQFFIRQFRSSIENTDSGLKTWSTAVRGYGFFAAVSSFFVQYIEAQNKYFCYFSQW